VLGATLSLLVTCERPLHPSSGVVVRRIAPPGWRPSEPGSAPSFTIHLTPKHGSWLNQAEIEIGLFSRQCLGRQRIRDLTLLRSETRAWNRRMNREKGKINRKFNRRQPDANSVTSATLQAVNDPCLKSHGEGGRVAQPFGFALTDPYVRLSRIRLFPKVTPIRPSAPRTGA
jgi:hypothetical protein